MSNSQFHRVLSSHEYETFTFPKEILYDENLSGNALKLLLIMLDFGKRPNWQLWQNHLLKVSNMGYTQYSTAIKNLESAGYVQRLRIREKGKWLPYSYKFCAFPIFKSEESKNPIHNESEPDAVFQTGKAKLENPNYNLSSNKNVLEDTTKLPEEKPEKEEVPKKENLVSSSFQKLKELEDIENISESQKATLYKKFSSDQILNALKAVDISKADSPFALIYKAIQRNYQPNITKTEKYSDSIEVYNKAVEFLDKRGSCPISLGIDDKNAYIYCGTARSSYPLGDENFHKDFVNDINNYIKRK